MTSPSGTRGSRAPHFIAKAVFAAVPGCLGPFLAAADHLLESDEFAPAVSRVRRAAELASRRVSLSNHLEWLSENGFSREDTRQIRYEVELWYADAPALALMAVIATKETQPSSSEKGCVPIMLTDWPAYQAKIAAEIGDAAVEYDRAVSAVRETLREVSRTIGSSATQTYPVDIAEVMDYLDTMCRVTVLTCALRRMFVRAEIRVRRKTQ